MYLIVCPLSGFGSIPGLDRVFQGIFPSQLHTANPSWASVAENGSISLNSTRQCQEAIATAIG